MGLPHSTANYDDLTDEVQAAARPNRRQVSNTQFSHTQFSHTSYNPFTLQISLLPRLVAQHPTPSCSTQRPRIGQSILFASLVPALKHSKLTHCIFSVPHCTSIVATLRGWWLGDCCQGVQSSVVSPVLDSPRKKR